MEREQFTFYRSFLNGISRIKNKTSRCEAYDAIVLYALDGMEPDLDKLSDMASLAFVMAKPNIDASRKKAEAGRRGGSSGSSNSDKQTGSKPEANASKPQASDEEANSKQEKEQGQEQGQDKEQMLYARERASASRFVPPTVEEVSAYCEERRNSVDPAAFVDFYASKGWKVGSSPMKDWKAAVRTWEQRDGRGPGTADKPKTNNPFLAMALEMEDEA